MSQRLTPERVADRELERLARRESRLMTELQEVAIERERWVAVQRALDPHHHDDHIEE